MRMNPLSKLTSTQGIFIPGFIIESKGNVIRESRISQQESQLSGIWRCINFIGRSSIEYSHCSLTEDSFVTQLINMAGKVIIVYQFSISKNRGFSVENFLDQQ